MKEFNLEAALNGEPVMLRNGDKAFIFKNVKNTHVLDFEVDYPLIGMIHNQAVVQTWSLDGRTSLTNDYADRDIVGMFEEPKISVEDLPKPFKPKLGEYYYRITSRSFYDTLDIREKEYTDPGYDDKTVNQGNAFRTREDAQKWLDFMKSMME